ncbi:hypothetical protein Pmani_016540 [Petrolisthes manimaculis]|uniref:Uncharacterized protein n=1 Tax=Petrolisthes manimaculis TaxID=1843537 RepID=A0AAE1PNX9_9EUCA|nr:hypothetical protein Pmani_016540 [Petrolisthes manimaculis]
MTTLVTVMADDNTCDCYGRYQYLSFGEVTEDVVTKLMNTKPRMCCVVEVPQAVWPSNPDLLCVVLYLHHLFNTLLGCVCVCLTLHTHVQRRLRREEEEEKEKRKMRRPRKNEETKKGGKEAIKKGEEKD